MDKDNVLSLTTDQDELDDDMRNWQSMTFKFRKLSDDMCLQKYGMTNTDLYNKLNDDIPASSITNESYSDGTSELEERIYKINQSSKVQLTTGCILIDDWLYADTPPYKNYRERLDQTFNNYLAQNVDIRNLSDSYSGDIWGMTVYDMYEYMKNKYNNWLSLGQMGFSSDTISDYVNEVKENYIHYDTLEKRVKELDLVSKHDTLYEDAVLTRLNREVTPYKNTMSDYDDDLPMVTPWFTPDELEDISDTEINPYDYAIVEPKEFNTNVRKAIAEKDEKKLLELGWNPSVPYTPEAIKYARERQINWFKENKGIQIIDISNYDFLEESSKKRKDVIEPVIQLEPIFITLISHEGINSKVIRGFTKSKFSHAGISLDSKLDQIFSFNATNDEGKGGFSVESLKFYSTSKGVKLMVLVFFVKPEVKKKLKEVIDYYKKNKDKTNYSFKDIFYIVLNKTADVGLSLSMICSQFVDSVLKAVKIDLTGKPSNLVTPGDFIRHPNSKMFAVYNGNLDNYKSSDTERKIKNLIASDMYPDGLLTEPLAEALRLIFEKKDLNGFFLETGDLKVDEVLKEIRELLTPTEVITEAKPLPIRFGKSGNLYIEMPKNLEREYQDAHLLLTSYNDSNLEGIKKQIAKLFYLNSIIEKKIKKMKKDDPEYKTLIDLRARILNDFKHYMKIIREDDMNFDFEEYMKNTEYYNKTIVVDKHTMKYTGKMIKDMSKMMVSGRG